MIIDLNEHFDQETIESDVLVIGAGAVGLVVAVALAKRGIKVALIESGGGQFEQKAQSLNTFTLTGRNHNGINEGRARIVGGTTTLWGGQIVPFSSLDFEPRDWVFKEGWPISKTDLEDYYQQVSDLLGLHPQYREDAAVWQTLKMSKTNIGNDFEIFLTRWLKETNLAKLFAKDLNKNHNLTVYTHAVVAEFCSTLNNGFIDQATALNFAEKPFLFKAKQIIITCGTIEASRLMLHSASKNNQLPWASNPLVGAYFQDHLDIKIAKVIALDKKRFHQTFDNIFLKGYKYQPKVRMSDEFQRESKSVNIASSFVFESSISEQFSDAKIFVRALLRGGMPENLANIPKHLYTLFTVFSPMAIRYVKDRRILSLSDKGVYLTLHCEQIPNENSRITLDWHKLDFLGMPGAKLHWEVEGAEIKAMNHYCQELNTQFQESKLAYLEIDPELTALNRNLIERCWDSNHQCGGLRMASSKEKGVVDKNLQVFGTTNFYVAGAAVFPTSSFANPTFTAMALGLRLVDNIIAQNNTL